MREDKKRRRVRSPLWQLPGDGLAEADAVDQLREPGRLARTGDTLGVPRGEVGDVLEADRPDELAHGAFLSLVDCH